MQTLSDTPPEIEQIQIDLLRKAGQTHRLQLALSLSQSMLSLSWHNLQQTHPHLSELEQKVKFIELLYGRDLAINFHNYRLKNNA